MFVFLEFFGLEKVFLFFFQCLNSSLYVSVNSFVTVTPAINYHTWIFYMLTINIYIYIFKFTLILQYIYTYMHIFHMYQMRL